MGNIAGMNEAPPQANLPAASTVLDYREGNNYYALLIKTSLLTFATLGIYRFWQTAALRRYYWSSIALDGDSFEYHGTGVETFLGFLLALVLAAIYLGLFVVAGSFAGLVIFENLSAIQYVAIIGFVPIFYFARYRYRRYLLSRTAWRGIRFGLMPGVWGYVWRGVVYLGLGLVTFGALAPLGRYRLEKYVNDRVRIGNQKLVMAGRWIGIYRAYLPFYIVALIALVRALMAWFSDEVYIPAPLDVILWLLALPLYIRYIVRSQRYFMRHRRLGAKITFDASFKTRGFLGRYAMGYLFALFSASAAFFAALFMVAIIFVTFALTSYLGIGDAFDLEAWLQSLEAEGMPNTRQLIAIFVPLVLLYLFTLVAFEVTRQVFVTQPVAKYLARNIAIQNPAALGEIGQGKIDDIRDADGFADALDIGFGF